MTDRDRLAADLAGPSWAGLSIEWDEVIPDETVADLADRLIALGWTHSNEATTHSKPSDAVPTLDEERLAPRTEAGKRLARGWNHELDQSIAAIEAEAASLDEESLARALEKVAMRPSGLSISSYHEHAAAIAKAYREDTDATD